MQAISLDFLGVPGSEVASKTADLIEKHGFPDDKRLGAGVVDGRSVWADGDTPAALVAALLAKASPSPCPYNRTQFKLASCCRCHKTNLPACDHEI